MILRIVLISVAHAISRFDRHLSLGRGSPGAFQDLCFLDGEEIDLLFDQLALTRGESLGPP